MDGSNTNFTIQSSSSHEPINQAGLKLSDTKVSGPDENGLYTAYTVLKIKDEKGKEKEYKLTRAGIPVDGRSGTSAIEYVKSHAESLIKNDPATRETILVGYAKIGTGGQTQKVSYKYSEDRSPILHKSDIPDKPVNLDKLEATESKAQFYETLKAIKEESNLLKLPAELTSSSKGKKSIYDKVRDGDSLSADNIRVISQFAKADGKWYETSSIDSPISWSPCHNDSLPGPIPPSLKPPYPFTNTDTVDLKNIDLDKKIMKWRSKDRAFQSTKQIMNQWTPSTFKRDPKSTFPNLLKRKKAEPKNEPLKIDLKESSYRDENEEVDLFSEISNVDVNPEKQQDAKQKISQIQVYYDAVNRENQFLIDCSKKDLLSNEEIQQIDELCNLASKEMAIRYNVSSLLTEICDSATGVFDDSTVISYPTIENQLFWDFSSGCWMEDDDHDRPGEGIENLFEDLISDQDKNFIKYMNEQLIHGDQISLQDIESLRTLRDQLLHPETGIRAKLEALHQAPAISDIDDTNKPHAIGSITHLMKEIDSNSIELKAQVANLPNNPSLACSKVAVQKLSTLKETLKQKYGNEFTKAGLAWHGNASFQRIIWQDEDFISALQDPDIVRAMLNDTDPVFQVGNINYTLSSIITYGLKDNIPSYLATATPNWKRVPEIDSSKWDKMDYMGRLPHDENLQPREPSVQNLLNFKQALDTVSNVFQEAIKEPVTIDEKTKAIYEKIENTSTDKLLEAIEDLLLKENAKALIKTHKRDSTEISALQLQCLDVMSEYDTFLNYHQGDHSKVLGYGIFSHALDTKHLMGVLYHGISGGEHSPWIGENRKEGVSALTNLLSEIENGTIDEPAASMLRARLVQVMDTIITFRNKAGIDLDTIERSLDISIPVAPKDEIDSNSIEKTHPLYNMDAVLAEGSEGGTFFTDLDSGILKQGTVQGMKKTINNKPVNQFVFNTSHHCNNNLNPLLQNHHSLHQHLSNNLQGVKFEIEYIDDVFDKYDTDSQKFLRDDNNKLGVRGIPQNKSRPATAVKIHFEGMGSVKVGISSEIGSLYNQVTVEVPGNQAPGKALSDMQTMLESIGLGAVVQVSDNKDKERLKIMTLFHTFCPRAAYNFERDQNTYNLSIDDLKQRIIQLDSNMEKILDEYMDNEDLFSMEEVYLGRKTLVIKNLGKKVRDKGGVGLLQGVGRESGKESGAKTVAKILKSGSKSTLDRCLEGNFTKGASFDVDFQQGAADSVYTRLICQENNGSNVHNTPMKYCFQILYDLDAVNSASTYCHTADNYGVRSENSPYKGNNHEYRTRLNLLELATQKNNEFKNDKQKKLENEVMIKRRVPPKLAVGIMCNSEDDKQLLIREMKNEGLITNDGKVKLPGSDKLIEVDDFFHVTNVVDESFWNSNSVI